MDLRTIYPCTTRPIAIPTSSCNSTTKQLWKKVDVFYAHAASVLVVGRIPRVWRGTGIMRGDMYNRLNSSGLHEGDLSYPTTRRGGQVIDVFCLTRPPTTKGLGAKQLCLIIRPRPTPTPEHRELRDERLGLRVLPHPTSDPQPLRVSKPGNLAQRGKGLDTSSNPTCLESPG
jgi:hypothetical protein